MAERDFLFSVCDYMNTYAGCANARDLALLDNVFAYLSVGFVCILILRLLERIYQEKLWRLFRWWNSYDSLTLNAMVSWAIKVGLHFSLRAMAAPDLDGISDSDIQAMVRRTVVLNFCFLFLSAVGFASFLEGIVKALCGTALWKGRAEGILRVVGFAISLSNLVLLLCFLYDGIGHTPFLFVLWRNLLSLVPPFTSTFVYLPLFISSSRAAIQSLEGRIRDAKHGSVKKIQRSVGLMKVFVILMASLLIVNALSISSACWANTLFSSSHHTLFWLKLVFDAVNLLSGLVMTVYVKLVTVQNKTEPLSPTVAVSDTTQSPSSLAT
ncbi:hypothetical protein HDV03_003978 [Kappamyces sp. JEL0829]|nr:hypothetical protein HDV03_003978 [Kappamyces sp. JEL0829]